MCQHKIAIGTLITILPLSAAFINPSTSSVTNLPKNTFLSATAPRRNDDAGTNDVVRHVAGGIGAFVAGLGFAARVALADPSVVDEYVAAPLSSLESPSTAITASTPSNILAAAQYETLDFSMPSYSDPSSTSSSSPSPPSFANPFTELKLPPPNTEKAAEDKAEEVKAAAEDKAKAAEEKKAAAEKAKEERLAAEKKKQEEVAARRAEEEKAAAEKKARVEAEKQKQREAAEKAKQAEAEEKAKRKEEAGAEEKEAPALPKFDIPSFKAPDISVPEVKAPAFDVPKFKTPAFDAPKFEKPDLSSLKAPEFKAPDIPKFDIPKPEYDLKGSDGVPNEDGELVLPPGVVGTQAERDERAKQAKQNYKDLDREAKLAEKQAKVARQTAKDAKKIAAAAKDEACATRPGGKIVCLRGLNIGY
eukprot:CAMPEP_0172504670 /NCGR_PEP_ID=MMETSP1066-20121228/180454_1 /TAXON_ID=671091 /ORGANISM="Coscinodiscus wailesii, Strain CCMP2513" /LENGTH=418 /DNA_ID=CAMNT_0013280945 /DNA_START=137 /DNA_END=1393 /DNA_ORIENTATION=-